MKKIIIGAAFALAGLGFTIAASESTLSTLEWRVNDLERRVGILDGQTPLPDPEPTPAPSPDPIPVPSPDPIPAPSPEAIPNPGPGTLPGAEGRGGGVFSVSCAFDHRASDDPIVFYGQPGAAHSHDFFGALNVDAWTDAEDLPLFGTTCGHASDTAAYWAPTLFGPDGVAAQPASMLAYYQAGKAVRAFPQGLKMIADVGSNPKTGFSCSLNGPFMPGPVDCSGGTLKMHVRFPFCWDGVNLDSPDHRSHMSFTCNADHPVELVHLNIHIQYKISNGSQYHLAPNPDGSLPSIHADFFNGWDQARLEHIVNVCINAGVDCKKNTNV